MSPQEIAKKNPADKAPTWDLESIFPGGSSSKEYAAFRDKIKKDLKSLTAKFAKLPPKLNTASRGKWADYIVAMQEFVSRLVEASAFSHCLVSQNVNDEKGHQIVGEIDVIRSEYEKLTVLLEAFAKKQSDKEWEKLVTSPKLNEVKFYLNEMRDIAKLKMAPEFEAFATDLAVNGYHAWNRLYDKMYGDLRGDFTEDGATKQLSLGQLALKTSSPDRDARRRAHQAIESAWESRANLASMALNFQAGFRLTMYEKRGWKSPLLEPLMNCRIKQKTLDAMWQAVAEAGPRLKKYIDAKKRLLGIDKFCWYDQTAPVGRSDRTYGFNEAGEFIIANFRMLGNELADFSRMALDKRWVEAEDRPGKAGGGYCTTLRVSKQSRIFMTWGGSFAELSTLAHELGHAYHHSVLKDNPVFSSVYPMTLAETASIFNELIVTNGAFEASRDDDEKLMLLDQKLQNAYILFCNLYARFLFDRAFYDERKKGLVSRSRLDEMMLAAQKEAFAGTLDPNEGFHKLFWASKLHFYLTDNPFYNFPYTFGFLFANGVYSRARKEGPAFAKKYRALLADTGKMTSEQVAKKHLGVDLTKPDFWREAVNLALADIDAFVKLAG
ncbi:Oligoendopeptidase, pepF/M3 family [Candidatus Zixiibacteriota bacterium]|nr:Oligoendopeptidase, pepF/M3 family [candidate division Zixibacteria bacterium]